MNNRNSACYVLTTILFLSACNVSNPVVQSPKDNSSSNVVEVGTDVIFHESEKETIVVPYRPDYVDEDKEYDVIEEMPQFPGGPEKLKEFLKENMRYPKELKGSGIQGRVIVTFVVKKNGKLSKAKVVRSIDPAFNKEALRLVRKMPRWIPGKQNGINVNVRYTIPISFKERDI
jgi:TonB family protein